MRILDDACQRDNQIYFFLLLFLSGQIAPLSILPHAVQIAAKYCLFTGRLVFPRNYCSEGYN